MRNVVNPIVLNPFYTTFDGNKIPWYRNILLHNVHALSPGPITLAGLDPAHKLEATLDNVTIDGLKAADITAKHATLIIRHGNLDPAGEDVHSPGTEGGAAPLQLRWQVPTLRPELPFPHLRRAHPARGQDPLRRRRRHRRFLQRPGRHQPRARPPAASSSSPPAPTASASSSPSPTSR